MSEKYQIPGATQAGALRCLLSWIFLLSPAAYFCMAGPGMPGADAKQSISEVRSCYERGEFERGIGIAQAAVTAARRERKPDEQLSGLLLMAEGYSSLGRQSDAIGVLKDAMKLAPSGHDTEQSIRIQHGLAVAYWRTGQAAIARDAFNRALQMADASKRNDLQAVILNDLGSTQAESGSLNSAIGNFERSAQLADEASLKSLRAIARINEAAVRIRQKRLDGLDDFLSENLRISRELPDSYQKALCLLSVGSHFWLSEWLLNLDSGWRLKAYDAYREGLSVARNVGSRRLISHALGSIGRLYEDEQRYDEALQYTREAAFVSREAEMADIIYLWEWQAARILRDRGDTEQAIAGYRRAIHAVEEVRNSLSQSSVPFQMVVGPVFREFADLLLRRSSAAQDLQAAQNDLMEVRTTLENLRQAEVADYFHDPCVVQLPGATRLESISAKAAIIYPVLLADRTELLISLPKALERFTVNVGLEKLTSEVREFRQSIDNYDPSDRFMAHARQLHDWLISPLEKSLRRDGIDTLVIIPDGPLRTIPISALNDGEAFLIEKYAVVTTPGLTLTNTGAVAQNRVQALASGLTESVQNFIALPNVEAELNGIQTVFSTKKLQDRDFKTSSVEREVAGGSYSIVHFATHGHFDSNEDQSFLVTYDGKLTMDGLQDTVGRRRYREEPVDLLVLSACESAAGDDRAALGLAGVGLKAGAKSVVATLWSISDESTSMLISEFYKQLKDPKNNKANALRAAQRALLKQEKFRHPYYWAPFLLIGNWL